MKIFILVLLAVIAYPTTPFVLRTPKITPKTSSCLYSSSNQHGQVDSPRLIPPLALLGLADTSYLTYNTLNPKITTSISSICDVMSSGAGGCVTKVMNSPYSSIGPVPLCAVGVLAYSVILLTSFSKSGVGAVIGKYLSASMAMASFALMYILGFLGAPCPFCLVSAFCSLAIFVSWWGRDELIKRTGGIAALGLAGGLVWTNVVDGGGAISPTPAPAYADSSPSIIRGGATAETSAKAPQALLKDLKSLDTKLYGAFWCSHCAEQKETLGSDWSKYVQYVECDKEGKDYKGQCKIDGEKLRGYPTWTISGIKIEGERSIEELTEIVQVIKEGGSTADL